MRTQKSSSIWCSKFLLIAICICLPFTGLAQRTETYKGNKITFSGFKNETIEVVDPVTGNKVRKTRKIEPEPIALNGEKIHADEGVPPQPSIDNGSIEDYIIKGLSKELKALPDGLYGLVIKQIIVDEQGKIAYYNFKGVEQQDFEHFGQFLKPDAVKGIKAGLEKLMDNAPAMKPATIKGKVVVALLPNAFLSTIITVKNHQATFYKN